MVGESRPSNVVLKTHSLPVSLLGFPTCWCHFQTGSHLVLAKYTKEF